MATFDPNLRQASVIFKIESCIKTKYKTPSTQRAMEYSNWPNLFENDKIIVNHNMINNLLINQGVSINETELNEIKRISSVKFKLPLTNETCCSFISLLGKPKTRRRRSGVYIFTHLSTGKKYVGSSNSLSRRMDQYFNKSSFNKNTGLFIPLIEKDGLQAFELEIFVMPPKYDSDYYFLFLEQYFLLHNTFELNTQKIVNFRVRQGKKIYLYDKSGEILYYVSLSLNQIKDNLGIHPNTCMKGINNQETYLNYFKITDQFITTSRKVDITLDELVKLISEKKLLFLKNDFFNKLSVPIAVTNSLTFEKQDFLSIKDAVIYFKEKNIILDRNKISQCIKTKEAYKGYTFSRV